MQLTGEKKEYMKKEKRMSPDCLSGRPSSIGNEDKNDERRKKNKKEARERDRA